MFPVTPELVIRAYAAGIFPMARSRDDPRIQWVDPDPRGILPLAGFHVPRRLRRTVRRDPFTITCDVAFQEVLDGCAEPGPGRDDTWINEEIAHLFHDLHDLGLAHSVEAWQDGILVGGLYGLALGGAFFGESMFSRRPEASKVTLVHLVARLRAGGFTLLDTQFVTEHLQQFGAREIARPEYHAMLHDALSVEATFPEHLSRPPLDYVLNDPPPGP